MRHTNWEKTDTVFRGRKRSFTSTSSFALWAVFALILIGLASYASLSLLSAPSASAVTTVPTKLNFQGRLSDASGNLKANGTYNMRFKLYTVATAGSAVWSEDRLVSATQGVTVTNGLFSVQLGSITSLPASLFASGALYLEVELPTPATATTASPTWTEGPMTPRNQMATSAYAYNSETLDGQDGAYYLDAGNLTGTMNNAQLSGSYTGITGTGVLAAGSITTGFGTINNADTITGTILNGTTGINTGAGAGTQRIDASGNLVNIGSITTSGTVTLGSTLNVTGGTTVTTLTTSGAATIGGTIKLQGASIEGGTDWIVFRNLATYSVANATAPGAFVIETSITSPTSVMTRTKIEGYFYDSSAPFSVDIGTYFNTAFTNRGYINVGSKKLSIRMARNITTGKVVIILGDELTNYSYPKITVTSFMEGHSGETDAHGSGWNISQQTDLSNYDNANGGAAGTTVTVPDVTSIPASQITAGTFGAGTFSTNGNLNVGGTGVMQIVGTTVITNARVLQNVTADTSILATGTLAVVRGGTGAATFTSNGIIYGNGTGALQVTAAGATGQCLVATTAAAPTWGACATGTASLSGNNTFTGTNTFQNTVTMSGAVSTGNNVTVGQTAGQSVLIQAGAGHHNIEIGRTDGVASTPYVDFHSGATATDFDSRIIASGGTGATAGGTLQFQAASLQLTGTTLVKKTDTAAFQVQSGASTSLFTADTQNMEISIGGALEVAGNISPSVSSQYFSSFGVMADSVGTDSVGWNSTIALGTDGYPSVVHKNNTTNGIRYVKCTAQNCSSLTATNVIAGGTIENSHSFYMNNSNLARIVYTNSNSVYLTSCTNSSCSTSTTTTVITDNATRAAVIKGADGFARILYHNSTSNQLKYIICTNDSCSTSSVSTTAATLETQLMKLAIALDSGGNLRMLYKTWDGTNYRDKYMACTNASCTTSGTIKIISANNLAFSSGLSLNMNSDGYAAYLYTYNTTLYYAKCSDVNCTTVTPLTINTGVQADMVSLVNDKNGMPSIAYGSSTNGQPAIISRCKDLSCSIRSNFSLATAGQHGATHAYDSNGIPYASFKNNNTSDDLMISSPSATVGGVNIGSSDKYIGDVYLSKLYAKESVFNGFDIAENYIATDMSVAAGDIVALSGGVNIEKASNGGNPNVIGVVSTKPGITLADWEKQASDRPVALAGRVPVNVTDENGPIKPGDYLTTSSTPGFAMKATIPGPAIGRAMESFSGESGKVLMFIDNSYYNPTSGTSMQGGDGVFTSLVISGQIKTSNLLVEGDSIFMGSITVNGHIVSGGEAPDMRAEIALGGAGNTDVELSLDGNDTSGEITITTGSDGQSYVSGDLVNLTFNKAFTKVPRIMLSASNEHAVRAEVFVTGRTKEGFILRTLEPLAPNTTYSFTYWAVE